MVLFSQFSLIVLRLSNTLEADMSFVLKFGEFWRSLQGINFGVASLSREQETTPQLPKNCAPAISDPLSVKMTGSSRQPIYPSRWKRGKVTPPFFIKNDELRKINYRSVTVLPALNNESEKADIFTLLKIQLLMALIPLVTRRPNRGTHISSWNVA